MSYMMHADSTSSGWYDKNRCGYCGVVHLGGDGKPIICPRLAPALPTHSHCPGCGCAREPKSEKL